MKNTLKHALGSGAVCVGGWLSTPSSVVAEAMANCGFDWIAVDMEHGPVSETEVSGIFMAMQCHGVAPLVRLPSADPYLARRLLDLGAVGFIIPVVESAEQFEGFADHCLYPPGGRRGVGLSRANTWGDSFDAYLSGFQPVLVPQIETRKGAEAAKEIAEMECVDALFIGPYDLSADLGVPGNFNAPAYREMLSAIRDACAAAGKAPGIHEVEPDPAQLTIRRKEGYRFIAFGTDMIAMRYAFRNLSEFK